MNGCIYLILGGAVLYVALVVVIISIVGINDDCGSYTYLEYSDEESRKDREYGKRY